jgi:P4 family phage/plasmid primase-like protien
MSESSLAQTAIEYAESGRCVLPPVAPGAKYPSILTNGEIQAVPWKICTERRASAAQLHAWFGNGAHVGVALAGGWASGTILYDGTRAAAEFLDIEDGETAAAFVALVTARGYAALLNRLPWEDPPRGGAHTGWLCAEGAGNTKLAMRQIGVRPDGSPDVKTLIETRGEGGLLVVAPTPAGIHPDVPERGYHMVRGSWAVMPVISAEARNALLECARALNEYVEPEPQDSPHRSYQEPPEGSPGEDFNRRAAKAEVLAILRRHGWTLDHSSRGTDFLRRPGKTEGYSATLGHVAANVLFVFSSNAWPFQGPHGDEPGTAYKPFSVYGLLECGGDFQLAARMLALSGYGHPSSDTASHATSNGAGPATPAAAISDPPDSDDPPPPEDVRETIIEMPRQPLPYSDQTNAETLVRWYGRDIRYCNEFRQWLFWDGHRWAYDTTQHVMRLAKATIKRLAATAETLDDEAAKALLAHIKTSLSVTRLKAMVTLAESEPGVAVKPADLDQNPWLLNCRNGTVDLRTGELHTHRREDWLTKCIDIDYNPNAVCPQWCSFLWRVMDGPLPNEDGLGQALLERHERAEKLVQFIQRAVGYSLTGVIAEHVLLFLYGGGQNGKSTFSETLAALLGEYFQKAPTHLLMLKERANLGAPSPELARLFGVRLVMACEIGEGQRLNESQVKDLTGDDIIVARNLYQGFIEFRPTYKLWMYGNHKPTISGTDEAIWRRPKLIPFTVKIPDEEVNPLFREQCLLPELSGILTWAIQGCLAWQKDGLKVPDVVAEATKDYRQEMDVIGQFIGECCTCIREASVKASVIYAEYCKWCETNHEMALKQRTFGGKLLERGFTSAKGTGGVRLWRGIGLAIPASTEVLSGA